MTSRLEELQREREKTIEKLKASTKYNSTQQLLEKYGGSTPQRSGSPGSVKKRKSVQRADDSPTVNARPGRTGVIPPPTANIPRNPAFSSPPGTPQQSLSGPANAFQQQPPLPPGLPDISMVQRPQTPQPGPPEFAPNAFTEPPQYAPNHGSSLGSSWYDRLMDVLLGDDETLPKNRLALICSHCKLVNGQAPPGVKSLADVGKWRCGGCGGWNGEEEAARRMVHDIQSRHQQRHQRGGVASNDHGQDMPGMRDVKMESDNEVYEEENEEQEGEEAPFETISDEMDADEEEPDDIEEQMAESRTLQDSTPANQEGENDGEKRKKLGISTRSTRSKGNSADTGTTAGTATGAGTKIGGSGSGSGSGNRRGKKKGGG